MRQWIKHHLPYGLTCGIARLINRPFLEPESRCERLVEYTWVLNNMKPGRTLDFGYAGSYFAQALTFFGPVHGVDLRETPPIAHFLFTHQREIPRTGVYDNIVCISVLEHHLDPYKWVRTFIGHLAPEGQILLTFPTGPGLVFKGYREVNREMLPPAWVANVEWSEIDLSLTDRPNTEHKVNRLALVRLTRPEPPQPPSWRSDPTLGSASE